nr:putative ribonuclease H-like domain-containing protein [Tanacetum cinerariifolium]
PNPVSAGQPNLVSAGDATLLLVIAFLYSFLLQIIFLITYNSLYSLYMTGGLNGKIVVKPSAVSQICDQTHRVLFTKNECLVLSKDFPLPDPSMVILSIPRKHNLYTFSLNELAPKGPLTCLIAKASPNESTLCYRRLGHVNFKNMNKLTEAVATSCYVLNRVLVTKPHDKTPYELLTEDKPSISYLKPFGCHVTILNTSDPLGKFDKKSDKGYIVGYSISSKAYRVYNLVSRKIEETMNLKFLENKPFVAGTAQAWMFDIDYLTDSLNYSRVSSTNLTAGSQGATPSNACSQEDDSDSDDEPDVLIVQSTPSPVVPIVDKATTQNDGTKEANRLGLAFPSLNLILGVSSASIGSSISVGSIPPDSAGSTPLMSLCASPIFADRHSISTSKSHVFAGRPTSFAGRPVSAGKPSGSADRIPVPAGRILGKFTVSASSDRFPRASNLENSNIHDGLKIVDCLKSGIFTSSSYDTEFSGPDANNLESSLDASSTITKMIHNIHPTSQVLGDINSPVQTRHQVKHKGSSESAFISYIHDQRRNNHTDFQLCMFSCFLSQVEPTTVAQALADPDWVEAMQAEMQQFMNQKVWFLVTLPNEKWAIWKKWILKNKRDTRGIVCRNKAKLVAQGHRQEEGIDYTDVFVPVARIEAIRLFLAFPSFMGFRVYQMDMKSAFLYEKIAEEVYVTQPKGFEDPDHPKKVYKVVKALYRLHQAPRAWYESLSTFLLKHRYRRGTIDKTLFIKKNSKDIMLV